MYKVGDTVAVFLDGEPSGATIANTGLVVGLPSGGALVYVPYLDTYCLADDETLIKCQQPPDALPPTFAEIVFEQIDSNTCLGKYRKLNGHKTTFEFLRFDGDHIGFDYAGEIENDGISLRNRHLTIRIPSSFELEITACTQILRQILNIEYVKIRAK